MLDITVDLKSLTRELDDLQQRQIPFATAKALSALALDVQQAERARLRDVFTLRREQWADHSIKITHFAKKAEPWATIAISPPGGASRADILGKFETDTEKRPFKGTHVAIPIEAKRNKRDIITRANRPGALHLRQVGKRIIGDKRTFLVKTRGGQELILQRTGRGKRSGVRALYLLVERVTITPDLEYYVTAERVVGKNWERRWDDAIALALATAR